jgi:hypothetical protein
MAQVAPTHQPEPHTAFDHFEEEYRSLEGVTRWGGPIRVGAAVIIAVGLIAAGAWWLMTPPPSSVHTPVYAASAGAPIEVTEPKRTTLANPPDRFAWDSVAGRLQYVVRIYVKGSPTPVLERRLTSPTLDLSSDEQARLPRGESFTWTVVAQGKDGSTIATGQGSFRVR